MTPWLYQFCERLWKLDSHWVKLESALIFFIFKGWGWDVTGWIASAGVIGVVMGFAAKDTLSNFFSGIFIMADAPYKEKIILI